MSSLLAKKQKAIYQRVSTYENRRRKKISETLHLNEQNYLLPNSTYHLPSQAPHPQGGHTEASWGFRALLPTLPTAINSNIRDLNEASKIKLFQRLFNFNKTSLPQLLNLLWSAIYLGLLQWPRFLLCVRSHGNDTDFNSNKQHGSPGSELAPDGSYVLTRTPNFPLVFHIADKIHDDGGDDFISMVFRLCCIILGFKTVSSAHTLGESAWIPIFFKNELCGAPG